MCVLIIIKKGNKLTLFPKYGQSIKSQNDKNSAPRVVGSIAERENTLLYLAVVPIIYNFQTDSSKLARVSNGREKKQESIGSTINSKKKVLQGQMPLTDSGSTETCLA